MTIELNKYSYIKTIRELYKLLQEDNGELGNRYSDIYYILTKIINANLLSIMVGITSGLAVNLFTNNAFNYIYGISILFLIVAIVFMVILVGLSEDYKKKYSEFSIAKKENPPSVNWNNAISFKPVWKRFFYQNLFLTIIFVFAAIIFIYLGNKEIIDIGQKKEQDNIKTLSTISDSLQQVNLKLHQQNKFILVLSDSLRNYMIEIQKLNRAKIK